MPDHERSRNKTMETGTARLVHRRGKLWVLGSDTGSPTAVSLRMYLLQPNVRGLGPDS